MPTTRSLIILGLAKGGIRLHTLYDITTQIPAFIHITTATVNDVNAMDQIPYESGAYYIFDRAYVWTFAQDNCPVSIFCCTG